MSRGISPSRIAPVKLRSLLLVTRTSLMTGVVFLASCQLFRKPAPPPEPVKQEWKYPGEWTGGDKPITKIVINVDTQRATLYHNNEIVGWTYVATGITSYPSPIGDFKILEKVKDKVSNLYGKGYDANGKLVNSDFKQGRDLLPAGGRFEAAKMTYFMRLTGDGVGMHIGPIPRPGRRASHGCIRLPSKMAPILFTHTVVGTPVSITGTGPDYGSYLAMSNRRAAENAAKYAAAKKKADDAAALAAAAALAPDDPNGPTPPAPGTTPPTANPPGTAPKIGETSAPPGTPGSTPPPSPAPKEEIKPAVPAKPTQPPSIGQQ